MRQGLWVLLGLVSLQASSAAAAPVDGVDFFEQKIRPVLAEHCYSCHSLRANKVRGKLLLDTRAGLRKGGVSGPALVPGKPEQSLLVEVLRYDSDVRMPPRSKLPDSVIQDFTRWIEAGAVDPRDDAATSSSGIDWKAARRFWAFQPVHPPALPAVNDVAWLKTPIDRFILAELEKHHLRPSPPADRRTLLRRVTFDLIGLPPTPEEVDAFVADESSEAYERVVDRLLASPHYGERWGRHWLDVARYAEDQAHTFGVKPYTEAWRFRDWVIDAFNSDLPYDRFVQLQIAADLLDDGSPQGRRQRAALGFFGLGAKYYKGSDKGRAEAEELDDRVDTLSRGFLGLTVSCARCHDHKFDPIAQQDYYSLAGVFSSCNLADVPLSPAAEVEHYQAAQKRLQEADRALQDLVRSEQIRLGQAHVSEIAAYMKAVWKLQDGSHRPLAEQARLDHLDPAMLDRWVKYLAPNNAAVRKVAALEGWRRLRRDGHSAAGVDQAAERFQKHVEDLLARRGEKTGKPLDQAGNQLLQSLFGERGVFALSTGEMLRRLPPERRQHMQSLQVEKQRRQKELPSAPLMAHGLVEAAPRDMHVFLRGNPATPGELAPRRFLRILAGDQPPKFRQGSGRRELAAAITAANNPLTARVIVNRLWQHHLGRGIVGTPSNLGQLGERPTHPELLDYLAGRLVATGWSLKKLHREVLLSAVYQQSSQVQQPAAELVDPDNRLLWRGNRRRLEIEAWRDALLAVSGRLDSSLGGPTTNLDSPDNCRRTVYGKISRHDLSGLLRLFDFPDANITSDRRTETTVPQQQLFVLNSPFFIRQAKSLAARVAAEPDEAACIHRAYRLALSRSPRPAELQLGLHYLHGHDEPGEAGRNTLTRWERYAQVLLGSNEFLHVD